MVQPGYQKQFNREKEIALDPIKSFQRLKAESRQTNERVNLDSTGELLQTTGFLEKIGADQIFMSDTSNFFQCPPSYQHEIKNRQKEHCQKTEDFQKWSDEAYRIGKKTFVSGGALRTGLTESYGF